MVSKKKMASGAVFLLAIFGFALVGGTNSPTLPQCSDGIDNDGDGMADNQDDGCRLVVGLSSDPMTPDPSIYCPSWDDEHHPPTTEQECG